MNFPCFFLILQEKGTTPLHVAAKAGQILQAELLVVYGADPGAPDINGRTPMDYARYKTAREHLIKQFVRNVSILNPLTFPSDIIVDAALKKTALAA